MMEQILEGLILGAVQGATEWLPISSEGALVLIQLHFFQRPPGESISFAVWLHLGTLLASVVYFRGELSHLLRSLPSWAFRREQLAVTERKFLDFLALSTITTGLVGAPLLLLSLDIGIYTALATALIGILLIITGLIQWHAPRLGQYTMAHLSGQDALLVGLMQGLSALPGLSRSGLTISALLLRGYQETEALRISFIMSIPVILGAQVLLELRSALLFDWAASLAGLGSALIVGWLTIAALMRLARQLPFWAFAIALGLLSLVAALLG